MLTSYELKYVSVHYGDSDYRYYYDLIETKRPWYAPWRKLVNKTRVYKVGDYYDFDSTDSVLYYDWDDTPCELATRLYNS